MRSPSPDDTLSSAEVERLNRLEVIVQRALDADVEVGNAFADINDAWLYRDTHQTFEAYLRDRWGIDRSRGYQLIEAGGIADPPAPDVDSLSPGTELEAGKLLLRLRLLLTQSSGAIANVVHQVETRSVDDDDAREQLRDDILVLDEEFATLKGCSSHRSIGMPRTSVCSPARSRRLTTATNTKTTDGDGRRAAHAESQRVRAESVDAAIALATEQRRTPP